MDKISCLQNDLRWFGGLYYLSKQQAKNWLFSERTSCRWREENNRLLFSVTGIDDQGLILTKDITSNEIWRCDGSSERYEIPTSFVVIVVFVSKCLLSTFLVESIVTDWVLKIWFLVCVESPKKWVKDKWNKADFFSFLGQIICMFNEGSLQ